MVLLKVTLLSLFKIGMTYFKECLLMIMYFGKLLPQSFTTCNLKNRLGYFLKAAFNYDCNQ